MTLAARALTRRRRRRKVLVVAPLLVVVPGALAYVALDVLAPASLVRTLTTALPSGWRAPPDAPRPGPQPTAPSSTPAATPSAPAPGSTVTPEAPASPEPPGRGYDIDSPDSVTVIVNKRRPLDPLEHAPDDLVPVAGAAVTLRAEAAEAFEEMRADAQRDGNPIAVHSATRTFAEQRTTFEGWVAHMGRERAERSSARAGFSEHQTGLAVDVVAVGDTCGVISCFGGTKASEWLAANAHRYGFVVRFDGAHEEWTGYKAEPWHLRYVGVEVATAVHEAGGPSLEEFFGLGPAPDYAD